MTDWTAEEADDEIAMYGPVDIAEAEDYAKKHQVDPVWRAALERALAAEGGSGGRKSHTHRRGRRG